MHNAIVMGIDSFEDNTIRVVFCNPTQLNMKIGNYICELCLYETDRKANYERHMQSFKHLKKVSKWQVKFFFVILKFI